MTLATHDLEPRVTLRMTIEEFDQLPDRTQYELVHGELVERRMGTESDWIGATIAYILETFNRRTGLGYVFGEADYALDPSDRHHFRRPDASFVLASRFPDGKLPLTRARLAPDLAVEVISPNDLAGEMNEKIKEYKRLGVRLIWVVFPASRTVDVYCADGRVYTLEEDQPISGEDVLPGFTSPVTDFFPKARR